MAFKVNRVIAWLLMAALVYGLCQAFGLLPEWAPKPFPVRTAAWHFVAPCADFRSP